MKGLHFGRFYDIPDEHELRSAHISKAEEKEAKRDRTFEEFLDMFKDHIEGKIDPETRIGNRPDTAEKAERGGGHNESLDGSRR